MHCLYAPVFEATLLARATGTTHCRNHAKYLEKWKFPCRRWRSSGGLRMCWIGRRRCGPSAAPPSPNSTPSPNPSSSTSLATPPPIRNSWPVSPVGEFADVQGGLQSRASRRSLHIEFRIFVSQCLSRLSGLSEIETIRATDSIARTKLVKDDFLIAEGHGNPAELTGVFCGMGQLGLHHQGHMIACDVNPAKVFRLMPANTSTLPVGRRHLLRAGKRSIRANTISVSEVRARQCTPLIDCSANSLVEWSGGEAEDGAARVAGGAGRAIRLAPAPRVSRGTLVNTLRRFNPGQHFPVLVGPRSAQARKGNVRKRG